LIRNCIWVCTLLELAKICHPSVGLKNSKTISKKGRHFKGFVFSHYQKNTEHIAYRVKTINSIVIVLVPFWAIAVIFFFYRLIHDSVTYVFFLLSNCILIRKNYLLWNKINVRQKIKFPMCIWELLLVFVVSSACRIFN